MEAKKIALTQTCCDWMATLITCKNLIDMPFDMVELLNNKDASILNDVLNTIRKSMPDGPMCNSSSTVLFSKDELLVLARVVEWFEEHLCRITPKIPEILLPKMKEKVEQLNRIKFKLQVHESTFNAN